jgi:DNA-binding HxlR family transcriptional regulator
MELVGERWSLLIVRELLLGPRRFTDLRGGLPGISAKVLTERLEGLEQAGVLMRRPLPPPASGQVYELTPWGYLAEEPLKALGFWAAHSPAHDPTLPLSSASLMISFRTMFDASRAGKGTVRVHMRIAGEDFRARIRKGALKVERGVPEDPEAVLTASSAMPIAAMVYGKVPVEALAEQGLAVDGDFAALARFVDCFHLPEKCS